MADEQLRILAVKAHPHDFTHIAGTLGVHVALGDSVTVVVSTSGAATHNEKLQAELRKPKAERDPDVINEPPDAYAAQKAEELHQAADLFGITDVRILNGPQPFLAHENPEVVQQIADAIMEVRPHVLIGQSPFLQRGVNSLSSGYQGDDHLQTAFAVQDAQRLANSPGPGSEYPAHRIAATFYPGVYFNRDDWDFAVDVTDWFQQRVDAEKLFKSQGHWDAWSEKRMELTLGNAGWFSGTTYAEGFVRAKPELVPSITLSPFTLRDAAEPPQARMDRIVGSPKPVE